MGKSIDQKKLNDLIDACWAHHAWVKENYPAILPEVEIPILWFGNLKKYFASKRRIVTVGLNPSKAEFQEGKRPTKQSAWSMHRFRAAKEIANYGSLRENSDMVKYQSALNEYFLGFSGKETTAYRIWFSSWNCILRSLQAGFDPLKNQSTAIHIDFCTPLATNPTWGELPPDTKESIVRNALQLGLWKGLVSFLQPHLILTCVSSFYIPQMVSSLGWSDEDTQETHPQACDRSTIHKVVHAFGNIQSGFVHLYAAPAGSPWKGWFKCQMEDFASEIAHTVWSVSSDGDSKIGGSKRN